MILLKVAEAETIQPM